MSYITAHNQFIIFSYEQCEIITWDAVVRALHVYIFGYIYATVMQHNLNVVHDDVMKWKHFPRYWTFVRGIHRTQASDAELWCFFDLRLNEGLSKQSWNWRFETPSRPLWRCSNVVTTVSSKYRLIVSKKYLYFCSLWVREVVCEKLYLCISYTHTHIYIIYISIYTYMRLACVVKRMRLLSAHNIAVTWV